MKTLLALFLMASAVNADVIGFRMRGTMEPFGSTTLTGDYDYTAVGRFDQDESIGHLALYMEPLPFPKDTQWDLTEDIMHETGNYGWTGDDDYLTIQFEGYSFMPASDPSTFMVGSFNGIELTYWHPSMQSNFEAGLRSNVESWEVFDAGFVPEPMGVGLAVMGGLILLCLARGIKG